ncbi:MAG: DMT family transporter [Elusimicrobia bacterium]|nr:DMT family transporter [Elusimicrobiota bacterium]
MLNPALFAVLALFWGGSFVAIKYVVAELPPFTGAAMRVIVGLATLFTVLRVMGRSSALPWRRRKGLWLVGLFSQGFPFALLFWGERHISAGLAGLINGTVPLWTFLLGVALGLEPAARSRRAWTGMSLGLAGTLLIFASVLTFAGGREETLGAAACLGMALCYAVGSLLARRQLVGEGAVDVNVGALHQQMAATAFLAVLALGVEGSPAALAPSWAALGATLYLGVLSTGVAFLIFFRLIRDWGALKTSAVTYVMPVVTLVLDRVFFGRWPRPIEAAGAAVVLAGVLVLHSGKLERTAA